MDTAVLSEAGLVVGWFALFVALGALALPAASAAFERFADRGAGLAIPFALFVLGIVGYWVGRISFGRASGVVGLVVLAALSTLALRRGVEVPWRRYGEAVAVFAVAFAFLVAVRALDPSVVAPGGEKFLDYGLLNGLYRADALPPEDPWFAGERVRYYYGGYLLVATLGRLAAVPPHYAYNLAVAGTYATLVTATYGLAGAIAAHRGVDRVRAGLFAAFFVGIASNLATPFRLLAWLLPGGRGIAGGLGVPLERAGETVAHGLGSFGYWDASRVLPDTINEFPLFAFLNGDLHPHMLSLPFLVLGIGFLFGYWVTPEGERTRRRLLALVAMPAVAGWLAVVNTWDAPTILGLTWLALALAPAAPRSLLPASVTAAGAGLAGALPARRDRQSRRRPDGAAELARPLVAGALVALVGVAAVCLVAPYVAGVTGAGGRSIEVVAERSPPVHFLLVHGAFLFVAAWYLAGRIDIGPATVSDGTVVAVALLAGLLWLLEAAPVAIGAALVLGGWYVVRTGRGGYETLLFVAGAGLVAAVELVYLSEGAGPGRLNTVFKSYVHVWIVWSIAAGVALSSLTSLDRWIETETGPTPSREGSAGARGPGAPARSDGGDDADGRPSSGRARDPPDVDSSNGRGGSDGTPYGLARRNRRKAMAVALALVCALSAYGALALADHVGAREGPTLDARHDVQANAPDEAAAFAWLADREGQPRIVEAPAPPGHTYGGNDASGAPPPSRHVTGASTFSGLPTIAGWTHSAAYHGDDVYWERVDDVETVYEGAERERAAVLYAYGVEYVYVGPNERAWYDLASLEDDEGIAIERQAGDVTIYRVDRAALADG